MHDMFPRTLAALPLPRPGGWGAGAAPTHHLAGEQGCPRRMAVEHPGSPSAAGVASRSDGNRVPRGGCHVVAAAAGRCCAPLGQGTGAFRVPMSGGTS